MFKSGEELICIKNKRTVYSGKPRLYVGKKYTCKLIIDIKHTKHVQLYEHIGYFYDCDEFKSIVQIRVDKLKEIDNAQKKI